MAVKLTADQGHVELAVEAAGVCVSQDVMQGALGDHYAPLGKDRAHLSLFIASRLAGRLGGRLEIATNEERGRTWFRARVPAGGA